jgi:hypothetical protein
VEYHLRNAYRKLDIRSREELAEELSRHSVLTSSAPPAPIRADSRAAQD